ncbi:hypothetical protein E4U54_007320 [Claviceps lovelessii]|nr:hypothetical protein E4U54_007320 [Claviceps lovelessii]
MGCHAVQSVGKNENQDKIEAQVPKTAGIKLRFRVEVLQLWQELQQREARILLTSTQQHKPNALLAIDNTVEAGMDGPRASE